MLPGIPRLRPNDGKKIARPDRFVAVRLPDLIIVDGGKGQLSSACRELQRLGLHDLPIIGLAKEYEEIYRPGRALPLVLPPESGALRLLQRIRDEAHRFANTYHQLLMKKRIGESILDDCPGRKPEPEKSSPPRIWFGEPAAKSDGRTDRSDRRDRAEIGAGSSSLSRAALRQGAGVGTPRCAVR